MRANPVVALWVAVALSAAVVAHPANVLAEDRGKGEAKKLLGQGDTLFAKKKWADALAKYQKAYEAFPSPQIFYPMAQTEEKLGQDLEAILHYEQLINDAPELKAELKSEAQARITQIEKRLALFSVTVKPVGAIILIDDIEVGSSPLGKPVRLKPGSHNVRVAKEGYKPQSKTFDLKAGPRDESITLALAGSSPGEVAENTDPAGSGDVEPSGPTLPDSPPPPPASNRTWLTVGLVSTGVLAAGATVTGFMARSKHATYEDDTKPVQEREDARSAGKTLALATDGLLVGAVLAAGFSAYWYWAVVKPGEQGWTGGSASRSRTLGRASPPASPFSVEVAAPYVGEGEAGLALTGSF